jgi:3-deoxy-manno-octulosonate cytidylyltransferase (CMP-KDO synthetase)
MIAIGVIPARYGSTRLPGKALLEIAGAPMLRHVFERAQAARRLDEVIVATDDVRIAAAVRDFGGEAVLTSPDHQSGTDRVAEACAGRTFDVVVNVQGDEPLLDPSDVDALVAALEARSDAELATLAVELPAEQASDPNAVKVALDRQGFALYFSRLPIPYRRDAVPGTVPGTYLKHKGIYAYRADALRRFASLPPTPLEQAESLEQLRALEHGMRVYVVVSQHDSIGVDTPDDLERVRRIVERERRPA